MDMNIYAYYGFRGFYEEYYYLKSAEMEVDM